MDSKFPINQILQRYQLPDGNNTISSYEEIRRINIDQGFIYTLIQTFENEKSISEKDYEKFSLEIIIDYIQRTHRYYLNKKLCEIEQSIHILLKDYSGNHPLLLILNSFFSKYTADLSSHIRTEEKQLLPYIKCLLKFKKAEASVVEFFVATKNYSLQKFINSHHDIEEDLSNVRNTILKYQPRQSNETPYRILISQLQAFEKDLLVHAFIEDNVLIPRALRLEAKVNRIFNEKIKLN